MMPSSQDPENLPIANQSNTVQKSEPTELINRSSIAQPPSPDGKDECYLQLAQVNLLRIRKQPAEAIQLCEDVLTKWPMRPDAHSLMGDLYQESERIDDAILRYCRVLELDPKSRTNKQKLADAVRQKRTRIAPVTTLNNSQKGLRHDRIIRAIILALATLMLVTIMAAPAVFERRQLTREQTNDSGTVDRRISLNPIMLQPIQLPNQTTSGDSSDALPAPTIRDPAEQALVELMSSDKSLLQIGVQVVDAQEDPTTNGFSITFMDRSTIAGPLTKQDILRDSLTIAQSANDRFGQRDVRQFTIRCLLLSTASAITPQPSAPVVSGTTSLAFVGTIQRSAVPGSSVSSSTLTNDQLSPYFINTWWQAGIF